MNKRVVIMSTAVIFCFALVVFRLAVLMLFDHNRLAAKAQSQYTGTRDVRFERGRIFDRRGRAIAVNVEAYSVYCNPKEIASPREAARAVAKVTGDKVLDIYRKMTSTKGFVWIKRKLNRDAAQALRALDLEGVGFLPDVKRFYPKGSLASHVLGFLGVDSQPLEGTELMYNEYLEGWEVTVPVARDAGGRTLSEGYDFRSGGSSVVLTLDEGLQFIVERALDEAMEEWEAPSAVAVMMNPMNGEIMAMTSRPTYDANDPVAYPVASRRNRAITDSYEPGSTFKLITATAALEENLVDAQTEFDTSAGYIRVGGKAIWDIHNHGIISFSDVIRTSSNVGTVMVGQQMDDGTLYSYVRRFGFGEKTGIDMAGESAGRVRHTSEWSETSRAAVSIGYEVAVTPMQLLRAYSAVANGGFLVTPHVVKQVISLEGDLLYQFSDKEQRRAISRVTANRIKKILVSVTQRGGTATRASVAGNLVAGKTGTTRLVDPETRRYSREKYASSFVGFVPADNPRVALIVVIFEPKKQYYGGQVAAPVFRKIAEETLAYLDVPREDSFRENVLRVKGVRYH
jgi:cell division protein FtsI (penicillin-binding protein 3)